MLESKLQTSLLSQEQIRLNELAANYFKDGIGGTLAKKYAERELGLEHENAFLRKRAEQAELTDSLTCLYNSNARGKFLGEKLATYDRTKKGFTYIQMDLDFFKTINDTYGHNIGDEVIKGFGDILRDEIRGNDRAFRVGGDEFAILIDGVLNDDEVQGITGRIRQKYELFTEQILKKSFSISQGYTTFPPDAADYSLELRNRGQAKMIKKIIGTADKALYEAKPSKKTIYKPLAA